MLLRAARQAAHELVLHAVRVLELVDEHVLEALGELVRHGRVAHAQAQRVQQEAAEVGGVRRRHALLVERVGLGDDVVEVVARLVAGRHVPWFSRRSTAESTCRTGNIRSGTLRSVSTRAMRRFWSSVS
jgi:hypothetical protein